MVTIFRLIELYLIILNLILVSTVQCSTRGTNIFQYFSQDVYIYYIRFRDL